MAKTGTFLVTAADEDSAVVRDVVAGQVHALASNPNVEVGDVLEATIEPEPPLELTWVVEEVSARRSVSVTRVPDPPSEAARRTATDLDSGEMTTLDSDGGEVHVIAVPPDQTATAADEVVEDEGTRSRAARLGADRVEVRSADGVVSVRYRGVADASTE